MDHHIVEVPGSDGHSGCAVMEPDDADGPTKAQEARECIDRWSTEREDMNAELGGIARDSGTGTED